MALKFLHSKEMNHGDIKPDNILVDTSTICPETNYKLGDLGQINDSGDGKYLAPELLGYDSDPPFLVLAMADIFSLGITVTEIAYECATRSPFNYKYGSQISIPNHQAAGFTSEFIELLRRMMHADPNLRPKPFQVLMDPVIRNDFEWLLYQEQLKNIQLTQKIDQLEQDLSRQKITFRVPPKKSKKEIISNLNLAHHSPLHSNPSLPLFSSLPTSAISLSDSPSSFISHAATCFDSSHPFVRSNSAPLAPGSPLASLSCSGSDNPSQLRPVLSLSAPLNGVQSQTIPSCKSPQSLNLFKPNTFSELSSGENISEKSSNLSIQTSVNSNGTSSPSSFAFSSGSVQPFVSPPLGTSPFFRANLSPTSVSPGFPFTFNQPTNP